MKTEQWGPYTVSYIRRWPFPYLGLTHCYAAYSSGGFARSQALFLLPAAWQVAFVG